MAMKMAVRPASSVITRSDWGYWQIVHTKVRIYDYTFIDC